MPRIFKGSGSTLRLLIHKCVNYNALGNLKVVLYTTNPEIAVQVTEGIVVEGNKVIFTLPSTAFASMDDGVINYIIEGTIDNDFFSTERQSDYYLKTPTSYIAEGGSYQEKYLNIHANGLYEVVPDDGKDAMTKVSVNVDVQNNVNLGHLDAEFEDRLDGSCWWYPDEQGLDGFDYVSINASAYGSHKYEEGYNQGYAEGQENCQGGGGSCKLTTLEVTENGTYTPPTIPVLVFDGDDMFDFAYADTPNAIEIRFKVNDSGWVFGNQKVGLFGESTGSVTVYWFGYEGSYGINNGEANTIVIKPYDTDAPIILNGVVYGMVEREIDDTDTTEIFLGNGNFDFYYGKFWSEYAEYNSEQTPLFYYLPNTDGNIKRSLLGGDFEVQNNEGGGVCQYTEVSEFDGFSIVDVNLPTIVVDATENGTIYTKYADIPEWTEPETGDGEFYDYLSVSANALSTGYVGDTNTVVEIWFRHNGGNTGGKVILQRYKSLNTSYRLFSEGETGQLLINRNTYTFPLPANVFNKIRFSTTGVWVNDVLVSEFAESYTETGNQWEIGGNGNCAVGDYGMIKIDDNVYTPVAGGYLSSAGTLLESVSIGSPFTYTFVKVQRPQVFDSLIKQVNVTVPIKAYDPNTGVNMSFQYSDMTAIPDNINFEGKTNWYRCFEQCRFLQDITALRNIKINNAEYMFNYCGSLTDLSVADTWDFSDCTSMSNMLSNAGIVDLSVTSYWNTSKVTNMSNLLNLSNLVTVGTLDCTSITGSYSNSPMYFPSTKLKNVGGFLNIKTSLESTYASPSRCPDLTKESYINIFNGLYDFTGNGETPNSNQGKIKIHSNAYDFLTDDDMAIAINKGWTITA